MEEQKTKKKRLSFDIGLGLALAGIGFVIGGQLFSELTTRIGGYIISLIGFVIMGQRLYTRIQERVRAKVKDPSE